MSDLNTQAPHGTPPVPAWPARLRRFWSAGAAACLLLALWLGPFPRIASVSFTMHMVLHLALVLGVAPLAVVALVRTGALRHAHFGIGAALAFSGIEMLVVWSWHTPALHLAAALSGRAFALQQLSFLITGMLVWLPGLANTGRRAAAAGTIAMLGSFMHMTMLGVLLALTPRQIYALGICGGAFGLDALTDQRLGGVLMALGGGLGYLTGALFFASRLLGFAPAPRDPIEIERKEI
ncbi:cytochrome c oxidase assembly protein [Aquicoccus sp. G2-2]|uniref:cytochrome c oxidase assembly protein n=1 Tax=Aquicoccus sp. G2-2 TaxID=3092120 RepID=UPI002AE04EB4|nr:cytochrome c oxidase assembly protein [Aquicoccus sp. G2-2]MEA1115285.1 cytochrome c oxidase assembly protein [Aquicoccus sp. G2-2]